MHYLRVNVILKEALKTAFLCDIDRSGGRFFARKKGPGAMVKVSVKYPCAAGRAINGSGVKQAFSDIRFRSNTRIQRSGMTSDEGF